MRWPGSTIRRLLTPTDAEIQGLAEVLIDCVHGGASVSFMSPLPLDKAAAFWRGIAAQLVDGAACSSSPRTRWASSAPCN